MASQEYKLLMQAKLDGSHAIDGEINKMKAELKAKGLDVIKLRTVIDDGFVKKATLQYEDATGKMVSANVTWEKSLDGVGNQLKKVESVTETAAKKTGGLTSSLAQGAKTAINYALGLGLIYKAIGEIGKGIQFIKSLDKEMRNVQIVAGYTDETISKLSVSYNQLAKEMGATTLEVASGSLEWIRQGKTIEQTQELLQSTLMLSKLGNVESADATQYLTSVLNGFKLEAKDAVGVVDRLVAVDNAAATSVKELATALQKGSVSAQKAGVDLDELIAYIGTVSSVTRQSSETIGTALKFF